MWTDVTAFPLLTWQRHVCFCVWAFVFLIYLILFEKQTDFPTDLFSKCLQQPGGRTRFRSPAWVAGARTLEPRHLLPSKRDENQDSTPGPPVWDAHIPGAVSSAQSYTLSGSSDRVPSPRPGSSCGPSALAEHAVPQRQAGQN